MYDRKSQKDAVMMANPNVLIASMDERWKKYRAELKRCKRDFSEEAVHDLRVATRRLLAVMDICRTLDPHPRVQKIRRALKNQLDALDDLRDTQVMLVEVSESVAELPELRSFEDHLLKREKKLLRKARKEIKSLGVSDLRKRIGRSRTALEENARGRGWTARLLSAVDQAYARARQAFGEVEAEQSASIHRFRVTFKKFRYMVEIVHPVLKDFPEAAHKQMHDYQSRMGDVQDVEVFLGALREFSEHESAVLPETVKEVFQSRQAELIATFMQAKDELHLFWREAPKRNFPWEKQNETIHHPSRDRRGSGNARSRRRQPAPADRQGQKEDAEDRTGVEGAGNGA